MFGDPFEPRPAKFYIHFPNHPSPEVQRLRHRISQGGVSIKIEEQQAEPLAKIISSWFNYDVTLLQKAAGMLNLKFREDFTRTKMLICRYEPHWEDLSEYLKCNVDVESFFLDSDLDVSKRIAFGLLALLPQHPGYSIPRHPGYSCSEPMPIFHLLLSSLNLLFQDQEKGMIGALQKKTIKLDFTKQIREVPAVCISLETQGSFIPCGCEPTDVGMRIQGTFSAEVILKYSYNPSVSSSMINLNTESCDPNNRNPICVSIPYVKFVRDLPTAAPQWVTPESTPQKVRPEKD